MSDQILISVIIPYNEDRGFLTEAKASFHDQDYENKELIISNSKNKVGFNLNRGIEQAKGELVTYLCDDDLLSPKALSNYVKNYDKEVDLYHGNSLILGYDEISIQKPKVEKPTLSELLAFNHIHGGTVCYNKRVFEKFGMFDESLWTAEEYEYHLRLLSNGINVKYINETLYQYRRHKKQKSLGNMNFVYQNSRKEAINEIKSRYENSSRNSN